MTNQEYKSKFLNKNCLRNLKILMRLALKVNRLLKLGCLIIDNNGDVIKELFIFEHDLYGNFRIFGNFTQLLLWPKNEKAVFESEEVKWCEYDEDLLKKVFGGYKIYMLKETINLEDL